MCIRDSYGIVKPQGEVGSGDSLIIEDLVEKPRAGAAPSNLAIAARYIFSPAIYEAISRTAVSYTHLDVYKRQPG